VNWYQLCRWRFSRGFNLDGNFKAEHSKMRNPDDEVIITDGTGFFVKEAPYKEHLQLAEESKQVGAAM